MSNLQDILRNPFQLSAFRPGQEAVISALLQGQSALAVFPTGGGKSLCYQLPALLFDGLTLVVSPLIALMKDQVDSLKALGIPAARVDSSLGADALSALYADIQQHKIKIVYVSPERLKNDRFVRRLAGIKISLLAIDEAHCISEWGHNFRPDYLMLAGIARKLNVERVLALTATATPDVAADICRQFAIDPQCHIQTSFARPNLQLQVTPCEAHERINLLLSRLRAQPADAATIIYVTLQKSAEEVAQAINAAGLAAVHYHAGLKDEEREQLQNRFMRGEVPVVVATIAFGMGIDKSDIRAVYHFNMPKSIENYVQEIGRAGRDGGPAWCEMFACGDDVRVLENFSYGDTPSRESLAELVNYLLSTDDVFDISNYELAQRFDLRPLVLSTALTYLEMQGIISAQGAFYAEYKIHFEQAPEFIVAQFDDERRNFLMQVFAAGSQGRKWLTLDMQRVEPPEKMRISKALDYLADKNWIELSVANLRQVYKNNRGPNSDASALCDYLADLFTAREIRDIQHIHGVINFANSPACLSQQLMHYFGETGAGACGICNHCCESPLRGIHLPGSAVLTTAQQDLIENLKREAHPVLRQARQLARFLCGLPSPATTRSPLRKHPAFGVLANVSFPQVLAAVE